MRRNVAGWSKETWFHRAGCGRYFLLERHTISNQFRLAEAAQHDIATGPVDQLQSSESARPPGVK
jgi:sarcosine oxidase delta subunit